MKETEKDPSTVQVVKIERGRAESARVSMVQEVPLTLIVNGRELATLIASPHDPHYLVAGFLYLQGLVSTFTDFHMLSVCPDSGMANVRIRGDVPERLQPVLTSGCGTGITFTVPAVPQKKTVPAPDVECRFQTAAVSSLMADLARRADQYRSHGGIHSAAIGDSTSLILHAEDIGRHNTLDRLAGEALWKNIDLSGKMLVTSGRISSEMAAKAASLRIALLASRTSPTDLAASICREAGIVLIGYLRGDAMTVYCHSELLVLPPVTTS